MIDDNYRIDLPFPVKPMGEWREKALCAEKIRNGEVPADFWFPPKGANTTKQRAICWECPVRRDCLDWALANNENDGVWGGVSARSRRAMDRVMPCCVCGADTNVGRKHIKKARCSEKCEAEYQATRKRGYVESGRAAVAQANYRERKAVA